MRIQAQHFLLLALCTLIFFAMAGTVVSLASPDDLISAVPEPYSELYISQGPTLKSGVVMFSFTIHNVQGRSSSYPYLIFAQSSSGQGQILKYDTLEVADGEYRSVDVHFGVPYNPAVIMVELPQTRQQVHFSIPLK